MEESINLILLGGIDDIRKHGGGVMKIWFRFFLLNLRSLGWRVF